MQTLTKNQNDLVNLCRDMWQANHFDQKKLAEGVVDLGLSDYLFRLPPKKPEIVREFEEYKLSAEYSRFSKDEKSQRYRKLLEFEDSRKYFDEVTRTENENVSDLIWLHQWKEYLDPTDSPRAALLDFKISHYMKGFQTYPLRFYRLCFSCFNSGYSKTADGTKEICQCQKKS